METFLTIIHVLIAIVLIGLVLIQDSKGGALGIGGGGSNSLLGAGGAQTLAAQATRWVAGLFAVTCIVLSIWTAQKTQSVVSGHVPEPAAAATPSANSPEAQNAAGAVATEGAQGNPKNGTPVSASPSEKK
jgi:preprotein translocase subunit SecG